MHRSAGWLGIRHAPLTACSLSWFLMAPCRDLSENNISECDGAVVSTLSSLTRLDLHTNDLEQVPPEMFKLPCIKQL